MVLKKSYVARTITRTTFENTECKIEAHMYLPDKYTNIALVRGDRIVVECEYLKGELECVTAIAYTNGIIERTGHVRIRKGENMRIEVITADEEQSLLIATSEKVEHLVNPQGVA